MLILLDKKLAELCIKKNDWQVTNMTIKSYAIHIIPQEEGRYFLNQNIFNEKGYYQLNGREGRDILPRSWHA